jgi:hypothetical protein
MKYILFYILVFILIFQACKGKNSKFKIPLSDLHFNSIFAGSKTDTMHAYCLLGSGYFRAPTSNNADSLINDWLAKHPNAEVISVATHGPTLSDYPNSKMTYCWIIDKQDTINNYLIRKGCFPGGTMTRPKTWIEMSEQEKAIWGEDPKIIVHVDKAAYEKFLDQISAAEDYAKQNRLGVWNKNEMEE